MDLSKIKPVIYAMIAAIVLTFAAFTASIIHVELYWALMCGIVPLKLFFWIEHPFNILKLVIPKSDNELIEKVSSGDMSAQQAAMAFIAIFSDKPIKASFKIIAFAFLFIFQMNVTYAGLFHWETLPFIALALLLSWVIKQTMFKNTSKVFMPLMTLSMLIYHFFG